MYFLPTEVQLDIFKCFDFNQLSYFRQTNRFYKNFVNEYDEELARKKFDKLEILYDFEGGSSYYELFMPEPKLYEFELSEQLEKKWKNGIEESIPMFICDFDISINIAVCELNQNTYHPGK
uniref:F-box domain-containing protein n=1 Tax=Meloidogyne incognita TaxID=6306 RepID=A0A914LLE5_MELIC